MTERRLTEDRERYLRESWTTNEGILGQGARDLFDEIDRLRVAGDALVEFGDGYEDWEEAVAAWCDLRRPGEET